MCVGDCARGGGACRTLVEKHRLALGRHRPAKRHWTNMQNGATIMAYQHSSIKFLQQCPAQSFLTASSNLTAMSPHPWDCSQCSFLHTVPF